MFLKIHFFNIRCKIVQHTKSGESAIMSWAKPYRERNNQNHSVHWGINPPLYHRPFSTPLSSPCFENWVARSKIFLEQLTFITQINLKFHQQLFGGKQLSEVTLYIHFLFRSLPPRKWKDVFHQFCNHLRSWLLHIC